MLPWAKCTFIPPLGSTPARSMRQWLRRPSQGRTLSTVLVRPPYPCPMLLRRTVLEECVVGVTARTGVLSRFLRLACLPLTFAGSPRGSGNGCVGLHKAVPCVLSLFVLLALAPCSFAGQSLKNVWIEFCGRFENRFGLESALKAENRVSVPESGIH